MAKTKQSQPKASNTANKTTDDKYALTSQAAGKTKAPALSYQPRDPKQYRPNIALIGCGGITEHHLRAYKAAGYDVVALCDCIEENARRRAQEFYPDARIYTDAQQVFRRDDIEVVDIATHPPERLPLLREALKARKHVLSQKPFVLDLETGEKLVALAEKQNVKLAVNQNGRWAPHFSYIREAVREGVLGDLISVHAQVHWDHSWVVNTPFNDIEELVFYDFAIHWFDFAASLLSANGDRRATRVQAAKSRAIGQTARPPLLAQTIIEFEGGQASLIFDAGVPFGADDHTYVAGTRGTISSHGPDLGAQKLTLTTADGNATPRLRGSWFLDGFHGTMAELLCAIEEDREPQNSARHNLNSLALCFAAIAAAVDGEAKVPGEVRKLPRGSVPSRTKTTR
ncbi:MAG: hypothetical protein JWN98_1067 [Abditibacteriota bacterium]|nr:hypothetical protein [Abditibacteriota bacterium]